jgi:hypothetical protein
MNSPQQQQTLTREFQGIWIPAHLWLRTDISALEKVFVAEIGSLSRRREGCTARDEHFTAFLQCSVGTLHRMLDHLESLGLITRETVSRVFARGGRVRTLRLTPLALAPGVGSNSHSEKWKAAATPPAAVPESSNSHSDSDPTSILRGHGGGTESECNKQQQQEDSCVAEVSPVTKPAPAAAASQTKKGPDGREEAPLRPEQETARDELRDLGVNGGTEVELARKYSLERIRNMIDRAKRDAKKPAAFVVAALHNDWPDDSCASERPSSQKEERPPAPPPRAVIPTRPEPERLAVEDETDDPEEIFRREREKMGRSLACPVEREKGPRQRGILKSIEAELKTRGPVGGIQ